MSKLQRTTWVLFCIAGVSLTGCDPSYRQPKEDQQGLSTTDLNAIANRIREIEAEWVSDYASADTNKLAEHYSYDATLMQPGVPAVSGLDKIAASISDSVKDPTSTFNIVTEKVEVAKSGDLAYSRGTYTVSTTDPRSKKDASHSGNYMTVYRKQADGTWKAIEDIAT